jgi:hypothetical protein
VEGGLVNYYDFPWMVEERVEWTDTVEKVEE